MARTAGKRSQPKARPAAAPAPVRATLPTAETEEESTGLGKKIMLVGIGLVVVAALAVLAINLATEEQQGTDAAEFLSPDVTVTGAPLTPFAGGAEDNSVGAVAPEIQSGDFSGAPISIEHDGTPKLILFLAHWCDHCRREVPALQSWINANGIPAGVELVSVATSISEIRPNYPPDVWLEREGWTPPVLVDDEASRIAQAYGLTSFPYYVAVNGAGEVQGRLAGEQPPSNVGAILASLAAGG